MRHDRQVMEAVLAESGVRSAYVNSWDAHHVATFGAFAVGIASQAYQFRLVDADDLVPPVDGLECGSAPPRTCDWLGSTGFQDDYTQYLDRNALSIASFDGREAGIADARPAPAGVLGAEHRDVRRPGAAPARCRPARSSPSRPAGCSTREVRRSRAAGGGTGPRGRPSRPPA